MSSDDLHNFLRRDLRVVYAQALSASDWREEIVALHHFAQQFDRCDLPLCLSRRGDNSLFERLHVAIELHKAHLAAVLFYETRDALNERLISGKGIDESEDESVNLLSGRLFNDVCANLIDQLIKGLCAELENGFDDADAQMVVEEFEAGRGGKFCRHGELAGSGCPVNE